MLDPFALEHLLPAGTLHLELDPEPGQGVHSWIQDWSTLNNFLKDHDLQLARASQAKRGHLDFLFKHDFVRATWRNVAAELHVRVYLVPFDLPGLRGRLRHRDKKVLDTARRYLFILLPTLDRCEIAWACHSAGSINFQPFIPPPSDARSLSEIFGDLPSPEVHASTFLSGASPETRAACKDALRWEAPPGMRPLFPYQRRTVARMIQQELDPGVAADPTYIPISGVCDSRTFYLQPATMLLLRECPMHAQARGGILCEEMGTGKTCMILALIMATKHQLSTPEDAPLNGPLDTQARPVLTPLAIRHFSSPQFKGARLAARMKDPQRTSVPTLVEILTHFISTSPERLGPSEFHTYIEQQPHLWDPIMRNLPFYHVYENIRDTPYSQRSRSNLGPRKVYLTSATLVVVPLAIMAQWNAEINKHCDGGSLRVLELGSRQKASPIPPTQDIASKYDIVLMSTRSFSFEQKERFDTSKLYSWQQCECKSPNGSRVPCCTCPVSESVSPLLQIRWKRLVVDEGHNCANRTNFAELVTNISAERKWIVTGTPTRNLMGVSLGTDKEVLVRSAGEPVPESTQASPHQVTRMDLDEDNDPSLCDGDGKMCYPEGTCMDLDDKPVPPPPWRDEDHDDLNRLRDLIVKIVGVPQFASDKELFKTQVIDPLMNRRSPPAFGAIQVVTQVMRQVMFRHRIRTVEEELPERLPPLKEKTVVLKFQPLAAKTYNVMQSVIAVNAVDSERKDQDYLFHRLNTKSLKAALQNLTQTMFWKTDQELFDIDEAIKRSESALEVALKKGRTDSDIQLLKDSIRVQNDAAHDQLWRDIMLHEDNPFVIHGLSPSLQNAWLKLDASPHENGVCLLDPDRIMTLRNILIKSPLISEERLIEHGFDVAAQEEKTAIKVKEGSRKGKRKRDDMSTNPMGKGGDSIIRKENLMAGSEKKLREIVREYDKAISRKERGVHTLPSQSFPSACSMRASHSPLASLKIGNTLSSKLDYILHKVLKHGGKEKFLIFSSQPLSLAYIAEALQVVQVKYLQYTSGVQERIRQQMVVTFETSERYRVLLMELKLGARGLNLVTASRIIFCEPIWQGDVESQAIKRAHRIGQKNDLIKVVTLVMQGTFEEAMVTRRQVLKQKSERLPAMEEDTDMRKFMQNPTFTTSENIEPHPPSLDILLVPQSSVDPAVPQPERVPVGASGPRVHFAPDGPPVKKRKAVHFG